MPYDEHLLERSRTQWQLGDWASLCQLNPGALQHHPDQAKLALLAAAGHLQMGEPAAARQWIRQAMEWGGDQRLMSRILIAGVHNSLGRAATVAGKSNQALHHFQQALATGIPGSEVRLLTPTRARLQAMQLGLAGAVPFLENLESASTAVALRSSELVFFAETMAKETQKIEQRLRKMQATLEKKQQTDNVNTLTQLEAFIRLQSYMGADFLMPDLHGWLISPDFGVLLIRRVESERYDAVIEFGSGASTVILAKALTRQGMKSDGQALPFVSFEHLEFYYGKTTQMLEQAGLQAQVDLTLAPLVPFTGPDGAAYHYYDCHERLQWLRGQLSSLATPRLLVVVDGPPGSTGLHARYPALPVLIEIFAGAAHLDLLLDDYIRTDEREIVPAWESWLAAQGMRFSREEWVKMEKQAVLLEIEARAA